MHVLAAPQARALDCIHDVLSHVHEGMVYALLLQAR
jgi:hypothetical protein